jgi:hypothetical protein
MEDMYINIEGYIIVARNVTTCVPPIHVLRRGGDATEPGVAGSSRRHAPVRVLCQILCAYKEGASDADFSHTLVLPPLFYSFVVMYRQN